MNHVLVVEDQVPIARLLRIWIEAEGATVAIATGAEQALLLAAEHAPSVAVCDIRLPGGRDGFWFVEQLRIFRPDTAVVMATGLPQFAGTADGEREGVADFVVKPFTRERIVEALRHGLADHRSRKERSSANQGTPIDAATALLTILRAQGGAAARHAERVSEVAVTLARALGLPEPEVIAIGCAALLADVQRLDIHAVAGKMPHLGTASTIALASGEYCDGTGFPLGLKGDAIPRGARIVAVANAYDELMMGAGPRGMPSSIAVGTLVGARSGKFDPDVLRVLEAVAPRLRSTAA